MDKAALLKTISLLEAEIETLTRAKKELLKELENGSRQSRLMNKIPKGMIQRFIKSNLDLNESKTTDALMVIVVQQNLPIKRASLDAALHRGVKQNQWMKDANGFRRKPQGSTQVDAEDT
jgi:hypothetical protein